MKVMTYNIRYANEDDGKNSWSARKHQLTEQIKFFEPEIIGFQEVLKEQLEHFKENLKGYEYTGEFEEGGREKDEFNAVFYKSEIFDIKEDGVFWLSESPEEPSKGWDAEFPRVCTCALFENRNSGEKFWILNTHFDHKGEKARKESAKLILEQTDKMNSGNHPVILMGDLNATLEEESVQLLAEKMNDSKKITKNVKFGPDGTFNKFEFKERVNRRIDFIFASKGNIEVSKYAVLSELIDLQFLSDHFPVLVQLRFN